MMSWIRNYLLSSVYDDVLHLRLLDEVDADSLNYAVPQYGKPLLPPISIAIGGAAVATASAYSCHYFGIAAGVSLFTAGTLGQYIANSISSLPSLFSSAIRSAKLMHQTLKSREQVTFGLGITSSLAQRQLRLKVFLTLQKFVTLLDSSSKELAQKVPDGVDHLLSNFYSADMQRLLREDSDENSPLISDGGISTLIDVSILHVSEICRLYIIYLSQLPIRDYITLSSFFHSLKQSLKLFLKECAVLSQLPNRPREKLNSPITAPKTSVEAHEAVALALENISSSILSNSVSPEEARFAIQKVLQMTWLRIQEEQPIIDRDITIPADAEIQPTMLHKISSPPVDQVFEAFVDENQPSQTYYDEDFSLEQSVLASSLMGELRMALGDRSKEFKLREQKALAKFYGISEEELQKREEEYEQQKKKEEKQLQEEVSHETMGEAVSDPEVWQPQRRAPLPNELLQALAKRGPVQEEVLGGSSDED